MIREAPKPVLVYDLNGINEAVVAAAVYFASLKNVPTELAYGYIL